MTLHWVDWTILLTMLAGMVGIATYTRRYSRSVADFLAANRTAGRYVLTLSEGMAGTGLVSFIFVFQQHYNAGFTPLWWGLMLSPVGLLVALSGFVIYRYRQTRAMTIAQFFEMRYNRRFRVFTGMLAFLSGVINYGVFPGVTSRFIVYYFGLPESLFSIDIPAMLWWDSFTHHVPTYALIMLIELGVALYLTLGSGQIGVMVTDFAQAMFSLLGLVLILLFVFLTFDWAGITEGLRQTEEGRSFINPFDAGKFDFNWIFFVIQAITVIYGTRAWQGSSAYNCAARNAHEAKMAGILGHWRGQSQGLIMFLLPVLALAIMYSGRYAEFAQPATQAMQSFSEDVIREQRVPVILSFVFPVGLAGIFGALMFAAGISTDDTYLHSWGSIFIQDVVMPFRRKALSSAQHIRLLRISIIGVAAFGFLFSYLFPLRQYIAMFFALTGAIYLGGAGSVIIGGLYWKRGTTAGAYAAMITGAVLGFGGLVIEQIWPAEGSRLALGVGANFAAWYESFGGWPAYLAFLDTPARFFAGSPEKWPINGQYMNGIAIGSSILMYIIFSLLRPGVADMDRLLHRGAYSVAEDKTERHGIARGWRALGITDEFSRGDRILYLSVLVWTVAWWAVFLAGTLYNFWRMYQGEMVSDGAWLAYWRVKVWIGFAMGVVTAVWFLIGGSIDIRRMFRDLRSKRRDVQDDGIVRGDEHVLESQAVEENDEP